MKQPPLGDSPASNGKDSSASMYSLPHPKMKTERNSGTKLAHLPHAPHTRKEAFFERLERSQVLEPLGLLVSAAALVCIVVILRMQDGQPVRPWRVSLNSLVSWLSTIARTGAILGATSAISQLKWTWFAERKRELVDLRIYDGASRGIGGSFELLVRQKTINFATLGAAAVILRIAFDPFVQNLVHLFDGQTVDSTQVARLARTEIYRSRESPIGYQNNDLDTSLKASVLSAILYPDQVNISQPLYSCPTSNCTWDRISTLAFCPLCVDASEYLERECKYSGGATRCTSQFSSGTLSMSYFMEDEWPYRNSTIFASTIPKRYKFSLLGGARRYPFPIFQSIRAIVNTNTTGSQGDRVSLIQNDTRIVGTECAMIPCVHRIEASVKDGFYNESIVEIRYPVGIWKTWDGNITVYSPEEKKDFGLDSQTYDAFFHTDFFHQQLVSTVYTYKFVIMSYSNSILRMFYTNFTKANCDTPEDPFACMFKAVCRGFTKAMRDASMPGTGLFSPDVAIGKVLVTTKFVRVEWVWLSLPVFVWVLSCVSWMGSAWKTNKTRVPRWGSNVLPLVFLYREAEGNGIRTDLVDERGDSSFAYELRAEELQVRLSSQDMRFKLKEE